MCTASTAATDVLSEADPLSAEESARLLQMLESDRACDSVAEIRHGVIRIRCCKESLQNSQAHDVAEKVVGELVLPTE